MLNIRRCDGHRATYLGHLQPNSLEVFRHRQFRETPCRTLRHHLGYELVRIKQCTPNSCKETSVSRATRIVGDVGDNCGPVTGEFGLCFFGDLLRGDWSIWAHSCSESRIVVQGILRSTHVRVEWVVFVALGWSQYHHAVAGGCAVKNQRSCPPSHPPATARWY